MALRTAIGALEMRPKARTSITSLSEVQRDGASSGFSSLGISSK